MAPNGDAYSSRDYPHRCTMTSNLPCPSGTRPNLNRQLGTAPLQPAAKRGRLIAGLVIILIWSPYLPGSGLVGSRIRLDNILIPLLLVALLASQALGQRQPWPRAATWYTLFLAWLGTVTIGTAFDLTGIPAVWSTTSILAAADSYSRPLALLVIGTWASLDPRARVQVARTVLWAGAPAVVLGVLQLVDSFAPPLNSAIIRYYDNGRGSGELTLSSLLSVGRSTSVFGQVSTFGMFSLLFVTLAATTPLAERSRSDYYRRGVLLLIGLAGGVASGSKVFSGGLVLLLAFSMFTADVRRRLRPAAMALGGAVVIVLWSILPSVIPASTELFERRSSSESLVDTFLGARFASDPDTGLEAKVVRTGAVGLASEHPITGIGYFGAAQTTDSMVLGLIVISGGVGLCLFIMAIFQVGRSLVRRCQYSDASTDRLHATALFLLLLVFTVASLGFHTFIQDRAGDVYWLLVGCAIGGVAPLFVGPGASGDWRQEVLHG